MTGDLIRRGENQRYIEAHGRTCKDRGKDWSSAAINQGMPEIAGSHQTLGRNKKGFFTGTFTGSMAPPTP